MNTARVIEKLQQQYPGKTIVKNNENNPTEIICEIEPTKKHPDYSINESSRLDAGRSSLDRCLN